MRIDRIQIQNFKRFEKKELNLNPRFTLLVGDNGAGKTALLDALAVAAGVWLVKPPDSTLASSVRNILRTDIRLESRTEGHRTTLFECKPVTVAAEGEIVSRNVTWLRQIRFGCTRTGNADAVEALNINKHHYSQAQDGIEVISPVIEYYGAGRSRIPSRNRRLTGTKGTGQHAGGMHSTIASGSGFGC